MAEPQLRAYYWDGDRPHSHAVRDISPTGLYLLTEDRWYLRTLVRLTLQANAAGAETISPIISPTISLESMVVRLGADGVALSFIFPHTQSSVAAGSKADRFQSGKSMVAHGADRKMLAEFLGHLSCDPGTPRKADILTISR